MRSISRIPNRHRMIFGWIGLLFIHPFFSQAQSESELNRQRWVVRNLFDQFPDEHVRSLAEQPTGVMWLGTWGEGLVRYDGLTRKRLRRRDGLPSDFIRRVCAGPEGSIWVATNGGASRLAEDGSILETFTEKEGLVSDDLFGMGIDSRGRVWLTGQGGISRIDPDRTVHQFGIDHPDMRENQGRSMAVDESRGVIWIGWGDGLVNAIDLETDNLSDKFPKRVYCDTENVNDLALDTDNNLWVGCDTGTFRFNGEGVESIRPISYTDEWGSGGLCAGTAGTMWLALQIGLALYDRGELTFFDYRDGLLQDNVTDVHVSKDGTVWTGTTGGLSFLTPSQFKPLDAPSPHEYRFFSVLVDSKGRVWSGGGDLSYLENGEWHSLNLTDAEFQSSYPSQVLETQDGRILSCWSRRGVYSWKDGQGEWLPDPPDTDQRFRALVEGPDGSLYLGNDKDGVYRFSEGAWEPLPTPASGHYPEVFSLGFDRQGALWIGGENAVFRYQNGAVEQMEFPDEGIDVTFQDIAIGPEGDVNFATDGLGVVTYSKGEWKSFHKKNSGLSTTKVYSLAFDAEGRLWVGTRSNGLYRFQEGGWFHYQRSEGLPPTRISDISLSKNGNVYLATYDAGLIEFIPERTPPETIITDIPKEGLVGENLILRLGGADAWQSTLMHRLQFTWKLDEGPWSTPSPEKILSIRVDHPGSHSFKAAAIDMDGNIDPSPEAATVIVSFPWWRHPVFYLLSTLLGLSILLLIILLIQRSQRLDRSLRETHSHQSQLEAIVEERTRALKRSEEKFRRLAEKLEESNRFKERLITNVSHDFRTPLTSLQGYAQLLASKSPGDLTEEQAEFLQIILNNATRMGLLIHNVAQAIQGDGMENALEMKPVGLMEVAWNSIRAHSIRAKDQRIDLEMVAEGREEDFYVMASRPLLERLLDNLITNGIKFTKSGGRVMVRLDNTEDLVILSVEDTGIGIDEKEIPHLFERFHKADSGEMAHAGGLGLGLSICKEIADAHGAQIEVESKKGEGSIFRVIWPDRRS